jgi:site-specific recombinase XerD
MGRYPLKQTIVKYMNATEKHQSPETVESNRRILNRLEHRYALLREGNPNLRPDPARWGEHEVTAVMLDMKNRGICHASQACELKVLTGLLRFVGNSVMDRMKAKMPYAFPKAQSKRGSSLSQEELSKVLMACEKMPGWRGEYARFLVWTYAFTGLRMSELRRAEVSDLDMKARTLRVSHPKGEMNWGEKRVVPIPEPLVPVISRYMRAREKILAEKGLLETTPLVFPARCPDKPLCTPTVERMMGEIRGLSGVKFTIHGLRRTYGQNLLNNGASIEAVSIALGHATTATTEKHYCRKDANSARLEVLKALESAAPMPSRQLPLIDRKERLPGYA